MKIRTALLKTADDAAQTPAWLVRDKGFGSCSGLGGIGAYADTWIRISGVKCMGRAKRRRGSSAFFTIGWRPIGEPGMIGASRQWEK